MATAIYELLAGMHIDKNGRYTKGAKIESDTDLVEVHGANKFRLVSGQPKVGSGLKTGTGNPTQGDPTPKNVIENPATAPHGQVSTGFQGASPEEARKILEESGKGQNELPPGQQTEGPKVDEAKYPSLKGQKAPANEREFHACLDRMSVQELKSLAEEEEIDLGSANTKDAIARKIKASF